ncbi:IRE protein kinase, partial [Sphaeroforma arctica JP610]
VYRYTSLRDGRVQVNNVRTGQHWYIEYPEPVVALYTTQHGSLVKEEINEETAAPTGGSEVGLTRDVTVGVYRGSIYSLPRGVEAQFLALVAEESDCQVGEVGCKPGKYTIQMEEKQTGLVPIGCRPGRASFPACLVGSHSIESVQSSTLVQSETTDDQVLGGNVDDAFVSPQRPTPVPTPSAIPSPVVSEVPILAFVGVALSAMTGTFLALLAGFLVWRKIMKKPQVKRTLSDTSWTSSTGDDIPSHISKSNGYTSSAESSFSKYDTSPSTSMSKYDRSPGVSSSKYDRSPEVSLDKYNESSVGSITTKIGRRESNGIDKQLLVTDAAGRVLLREVSVADGAEGVRLQGKKLPETENSQNIVKATDGDSTDIVPDDWESLAEPDSLHPAASVTLESLERSGPIQRRHTSSSEEPYRVGNLVVNPNGVLGHGAQGTMVYTGFFDRRPVAVKRLLAEYFELANMEVDLLQQSDSHANVIRYFCKEQDTQFLYIALELCKGSLADVVSRKFDTGLTNKDIMKDMMNGLVHLHSLNIVHRDIKPGNVLVSSENRILISDFGLCKKLPDDKSSYATQVSGTQGWIAPEFLIHGRMTRAVDIFAAGCVLFYLVSEGCHPFGRPFEREMNIRNNKPDLFVLEGHHEIYDLVKNMLQFNPSERPSAKLVLRHPFFWNADTCLQFLSDVSDRFEKVDKADPALLHIETNAHTVVGADWHKRLDRLLIADLRKFRTYRGDSVRDLMRVMRNKKNHYQELSPELKVAIGKVPIGYYEYFRSRFPNLVLHVFKFMLDSGEDNDYRFHRYFGSKE